MNLFQLSLTGATKLVITSYKDIIFNNRFEFVFSHHSLTVMEQQPILTLLPIFGIANNNLKCEKLSFRYLGLLFFDFYLQSYQFST